MVIPEEHTAINPRKIARVSAVYLGRRMLFFFQILKQKPTTYMYVCILFAVNHFAHAQ